jgi:hypothetical protein
MAYLSRETIAANGAQGLTVPAAAKFARITVRGGSFSFVYGGDDPTAGTWYPLTLGQYLDIEIEDTSVSPISIIRDVADTGTVYVSYFDAIPKLRVGT